MFDVFLSPVRQPDVTHTHHEHRAPTDQSVALLREMEAKALERVIAAGRLESNSLHCEWKVIEDACSMTVTAVCRFDLNGQEHSVRVPIRAGMARDREAIANLILSAVQEEVAMQITLPLFLSATTRAALR